MSQPNTAPTIPDVVADQDSPAEPTKAKTPRGPSRKRPTTKTKPQGQSTKRRPERMPKGDPRPGSGPVKVRPHRDHAYLAKLTELTASYALDADAFTRINSKEQPLRFSIAFTIISNFLEVDNVGGRIDNAVALTYQMHRIHPLDAHLFDEVVEGTKAARAALLSAYRRIQEENKVSPRPQTQQPKFQHRTIRPSTVVEAA